MGSDRRRVCGRLTYAGQACTEPAPRVTLGLVARPVQSRNALTGALTEYSARPPEHRPKLYGFLLFDERESHRPVAAFAEDQLAWLDALAASANIVLFLFLRPEPAQAASGGDSQLVAVESAEAIENPSLRVAGALDVRPHELPGIVFFTRLNVDHGPNEGVYWPIPVELFEGNRRRAENDFAQLSRWYRRCFRALQGPIESWWNSRPLYARPVAHGPAPRSSLRSEMVSYASSDFRAR